MKKKLLRRLFVLITALAYRLESKGTVWVGSRSEGIAVRLGPLEISSEEHWAMDIGVAEVGLWIGRRRLTLVVEDGEDCINGSGFYIDNFPGRQYN